MISRGQLLVLHRGVYALGHACLSMRGRLHAALLAAGPEAFLSHGTAAAHRGLRSHPATVELTVPADHTPRRRPGLHLHRTTVLTDRHQARAYQGLLTATVPRIVVDLAGRERATEIQRLIREAIRTGQFDLPALRVVVDGPGAGLARAALSRYLPGSEDRRSWLETSFQSHQRHDSRLPVPLYNRHLCGFEVDVVWPEQRVTLELDGRSYHVAVGEFDRDRAKDRALTREHWRPLRVSDIEWEFDRTHVLHDLYAILGV